MNAAVHSERRQVPNAPDRGSLDVLILGGGLAGAAAAIELARAHRSVALVERSVEAHDKVCGEFLSGEAVADLRSLGVDPVALGAVPIDTVRVAGNLGVSQARLPFPALSLTRRVLDDALLQRAANVGALVLRGRSAEGLVRCPDSWCAEIAGPTRNYTLEAPDVLLATGKHDMRGLPRPPGVQNDLIAFKTYLRLAGEQTSALGSAIELMLFRDGYGGLQLVENGTANLCWVVRKSRVRALGGGWESALSAMCSENAWLRKRLDGAQTLFTRALAIGSIPYGWVRHDSVARGLWSIGDQAAVIPSFTGDGMSLALHSGRLAARMLLAGETAQHFQLRFHEQVSRQVGLATVLSRAMISQPHRTLLEAGMRLWPGALRRIATGTRLPERHRLSGLPEPHLARA